MNPASPPSARPHGAAVASAPADPSLRWAALAVSALCASAIAAAEGGALRFTPAPEAGGIDLVMTSGSMPSREILEVDGGGAALFDYDRDGDVDVFLANGATLDSPLQGPGSRLYSNRGDGTFDDVTARVGIDLRCWAMGAAVGDVDGDGWDDLYVTCWGANALLRNTAAADGGRRFDDVAARSGVADERWSTSAAFGDLDGDGDLDLYVANYLELDPESPPDRAGKTYKGVPVMAGPRGLPSQPDVLYENLGDGRFRDVTGAAGVGEPPGTDYGLGVRILDFDADGLADIFVGNDSTADRLYRNRGAWRFEDVAVTAGVAANGIGATQATMGIALADVDGNALPDLFLTVFSDDTNTLHLNLGGGFFDDRSAQYGLAAVSRPFLGWGCGFQDFDLDGDEDLFVANGHVYPEMESPEIGAAWAQEPLLFERRGGRFERVDCADPWCAERVHGRATAFGDVDGDRDVDVLMTTLGGPVLLLRNEPPPRPALAVRLAGPAGNPRGYGSVVEAEAGDAVQRRWVTGGGSYQSVDEPAAFFGFAAAPSDGVGVRVEWQDGAVSRHLGVPPDRTVVLRHPGGGEGSPRAHGDGSSGADEAALDRLDGAADGW